MTTNEAVENAVRLLQAAEGETNLAIAESLTRIAECWVSCAHLLED